MKRTILSGRKKRIVAAAAALFALALAGAGHARAQAMPYARTYPKTKAEVDQALKEMGAYAGQKLPIVDGFVAQTPKPITHYERAFYQLEIQLFPGTGARGGTVAQVSAKITAWYADSDPSKSGYEVLPSNGRLEFDLLDRLDEKLGTARPGALRVSGTASSGIVAPRAKLDLSGVPGVSQLTNSGAPSGPLPNDELKALRTRREDNEKREQELSAQLENLQEVQKNQAHPLNLVAVKKSGTPVTARPAEGARVLFLAAAGDEFEYLDADGAWLHVGISGVSRGYVKRSSVELTDFIEARLKAQEEAEGAKSRAPFQIEREEVSLFPGDWENLKGKRVKIYTVQPASQVAAETDARAKLSFAATLFKKFTPEDGVAVEGVVVIYDSADGGIIGATLASVEGMADGTLSKENFWKQCYLDPPEAFDPSAKH
ncbi:MAG TPA: hypothetical protein VKF79_12470 [Candidatus Acidoferrum sp.]|nr:hypothetical protein [Candidatus Acidoferrum sp.]